MKKKLSTIFLIGIFSVTYGQTGINTTNPRATLDVKESSTGISKAEGIIIPTLTGQQISGMSFNLLPGHYGLLVQATSSIPQNTQSKYNTSVKGLYMYNDDTTVFKTSRWTLLQPTGLELVTINSKSGYRLISTRNFYDSPIGNYATDLSFSNGASYGAQGDYSFSTGYNNVSTGLYSATIGYNNIASSASSLALGEGSKTYSYRQIALGSYNTVENLPVPNRYDPDNRKLVVIGNGTYTTDTSDAFAILRDGRTAVNIDNFETTGSDAKFQVNGKVLIGDFGDKSTNNNTISTAGNAKAQLDVRGDVAISNLATDNTATKVLVADTNGVLKSVDKSGFAAPLSNSTTNTINGNTVERAALTGDVTATANSNSTTIANNAVTSAKIADGTILAADLNQMGATNTQVLKWNGTAWTPQRDDAAEVVIMSNPQGNGIACTVSNWGAVLDFGQGIAQCVRKFNEETYFWWYQGMAIATSITTPQPYGYTIPISNLVWIEGPLKSAIGTTQSDTAFLNSAAKYFDSSLNATTNSITYVKTFDGKQYYIPQGGAMVMTKRIN